MAIRAKFIAVALVAAVAGFMLESSSPVGAAIWPPHPGESEPAGAALGGLIAMGIIEALAFGAGVAFLVFGWSVVRRAPGVSPGLATAAYAAIGWGLVSWVPHTAMHVSNAPGDFARLVAIEYVFHFTLILCAAVLALYAWQVAKAAAARSVAVGAPERAQPAKAR